MRPFERELADVSAALNRLDKKLFISQMVQNPQVQEARERMRSSLADLFDLLGFSDIVDEAGR